MDDLKSKVELIQPIIFKTNLLLRQNNGAKPMALNLTLNVDMRMIRNVDNVDIGETDDTPWAAV